MESLLVAAYKPPFISSNVYLGRLKRHFGIKKGGYLGTLDPFAQGVLVVGFGSYTRLFPHLQKTPKVYRATLWLGAKSLSLDIEHITLVECVKEQSKAHISEILESLRGTLSYTPPKFSARHINGKRAYELARRGEEFELSQTQMTIYDIKLLHYNHPFLHFEVSVSEGAYVRSIGAMITENLGVNGVLSHLERASEGEMSVSQTQGLKILNPIEFLPYKRLENMQKFYDDMCCGKKILLKNTEKGKYIVCFDDFFSIIQVLSDGSVEYIVNRIELC